MWGAQGGGNAKQSSSYGGYSCGWKELNKSTNLYVCIGRQGTTHTGGTNGVAGGYNGGGSGGNSNTQYHGGAGGGGATHIASSDRGVLSNYVNYKSEVLIVAGGAGGCDGAGSAAHDYGVQGGTGGGESGGNSGGNIGGTQSTGYAFGLGENGKAGNQFGGGRAEGSGGGGGGWFGGYSQYNSGGGGGSGYIGGVSNGSTTAGVQSGNGKALITWMPVL